MRKWLAAAAVSAPLLLSCTSPCQSPSRLPPPPEGLSVELSERHTVNLQPGIQSFNLALHTRGIAARSIAVQVNGTKRRVTIEVAQLTGAPKEINPVPGEDTYQYLQIGHENLDDTDIESVKISFGVARDWIDSNGIR